MSARCVVEVEQAAVATWIASTSHRAQGWLLRHSPRFERKRSNSALPPAEVFDPAEAMRRVEAFYAERSAVPVVQVSPLHWHGELDAHLAERGYRISTPAVVLVAEAGGLSARASDEFSVVLDEKPEPRWFAACAAIGAGVEPSLTDLPRPARYVVAFHDGEPVGVGVFVVAGDWCGIYGIETAPAHRGRGVARTVLAAGARWAADASASRLFLQVEADNVTARRLYEHVGFTFLHEYHFRTRDRIGESS